MKIKRFIRESAAARWAVLLLTAIFCLSVFWVSRASATTLENAFAVIFEKLNANISAKGEVVAILSEKNEVVVEFSGDMVPSYGAELLIFGVSAEASQESAESTESGSENRSLIYRGSLTVSESAGHLNRAVADEGQNQFIVGDQVFLPSPVQLYITPVKNLTQNPYFTSQATNSINRLLSTLSGLQVFSIPASNQKTVDFLKQKCRNEGRYGLILQPFVVVQNGRSKAQLRLISLFSGHSIGVLEDEFTAITASSQNFRGVNK